MLSNALKLLAGGFLIGWGPCLAHCGFLLLPYIAGTTTTWKAGMKVGLVFSGGRILALAILGALATFAFDFITRFFPPNKSYFLPLTIAIFVIILGVLIFFGKMDSMHFAKVPFPKKGIMQKISGNMLILGFLVGMSPCAPLIAVITYIACKTEYIATGMLYAVSFGIGTAVAPVVLGAITGILPEKLVRSTKSRKVFQFVSGSVLVAFGLELVYSIFVAF